MNRRFVGTISPFLLIFGCRLVEQRAGSALGVWVWVPTMLLFWGAIAVLVAYVGGRASVAAWSRWHGKGSWWCLPAVVVGVLTLPGFIAHWRVVLRKDVLVLWLLFALVNPLFEEAYWRGLLQDATREWQGALSVAYSATLFAVSHPLIWGVRSAGLGDWRVVPVLAAVGVVWALAYRQTGSLRCSVLGHMCSNLFGLSVPILLNLHSPLTR